MKIASVKRLAALLLPMSVVITLTLVVVLARSYTPALAQLDDDGPGDMQELCEFFADQDDDFVFALTWTNGDTQFNPNGHAYAEFLPESILWCGQDFVCFDEPFERFDGNDGDMCLPYSAIQQIWLPDGGIGD